MGVCYCLHMYHEAQLSKDRHKHLRFAPPDQVLVKMFATHVRAVFRVLDCMQGMLYDFGMISPCIINGNGREATGHDPTVVQYVPISFANLELVIRMPVPSFVLASSLYLVLTSLDDVESYADHCGGHSQFHVDRHVVLVPNPTLGSAFLLDLMQSTRDISNTILLRAVSFLDLEMTTVYCKWSSLQLAGEGEDYTYSLAMEMTENLEDASNELILADEEIVRFQLGEVFSHMPKEEVESRLDSLKEETMKELEKLEEEKESVLAQMAELKKILYGKFKDSINLEED
eukprot:Gb_18455 [translate_table: standard]